MEIHPQPSLPALQFMEENINTICKGKEIKEEVIRAAFDQVKESLTDPDLKDSAANIKERLSKIKLTVARAKRDPNQRPDIEQQKIYEALENGVAECLQAVELLKKQPQTQGRYTESNVLSKQPPPSVSSRHLDEVKKSNAFHEEALQEGQRILNELGLPQSMLSQFIQDYCEDQLSKLNVNSAFLIRKSSSIKDQPNKITYVITQRHKVSDKWKLDNWIFSYNVSSGKWDFKDGKNQWHHYDTLQELIDKHFPGSQPLPYDANKMPSTVQGYIQSNSKYLPSL